MLQTGAICRDSGTKNAERSAGSSQATTLTRSFRPYARRRGLHLCIGVLVAEVARVRIAAEARAPGRRHLLLLHRLPVHAGEEGMRLHLRLSSPPHRDLLRVGGSRAEPRRGVALEKERNEIAGLQREVRLDLTRISDCTVNRSLALITLQNITFRFLS